MTQLTIPARFDKLPAAEAASRTHAKTRRKPVRHYQIGCVPVSLRTELSWVAAAYHDCYRQYQIRFPPRDSFQIEVITKRSWRTGRISYHTLGNGEELFATRRNDAVWPQMECAVNNLVAQYLPGHLQIHASVMCHNGIGVMFPGWPGVGKSTLAAALLMRGWSYLSDEFALIDPNTHWLIPYPKAFCIKAGSFRPLEKLGLSLKYAKVHHKGIKGRVAVLNPLAVRHNAVGHDCPIGMICFPEYGQGASPAIEPLSRARAAFDLTDVSFNFVKFRRRGVDLLANVVRRASCYRLRTGNLEKTCELIESSLPRMSGRGTT